MKRLPASTKTLVSAGDNIYRFPLKPLWKHFLKTGVLTLDNKDRVLRLHEKPRNPLSTWCCPPLYFLQESAWKLLDEYIKVSDRYDAPGSFIDFLCQHEDVYTFKPAAGRLDIGSIRTYREADKLLRKESIFLSKSD